MLAQSIVFVSGGYRERGHERGMNRIHEPDFLRRRIAATNFDESYRHDHCVSPCVLAGAWVTPCCDAVLVEDDVCDVSRPGELDDKVTHDALEVDPGIAVSCAASGVKQMVNQ